jgi:chemotaxis protein methyltransferase CheR
LHEGNLSAVATLLESLQPEPNDPAFGQLMLDLSQAFANQGNHATARYWCERALVIDKINPHIHFLLATILDAEGLSEGSVDELRKALFLDQDFVPAHFALGMILQRLGKSYEAEKQFNTVLDLLKHTPDHVSLDDVEGLNAGRLREMARTFLQRTG